MAMPTIDRGKSLRSGVGLVLLFSASFAVTLWKTQFAFPTVPVAASEVWSRATPRLIRPVTTEALASGAPPEAMPAPSPQDLALDNDPAGRDEAQALMGLLEMEPVYD